MKKSEQLFQLEDNFEKNGFEVIIANNGKDGFEVARKAKPDLILSENQLNGLDGIDLCYMVRNNSKLTSTPFILITNYMNREERINAYRNGVDAIVTSSISMRELIIRIEMIILNYELLTNKTLKSSQSMIGKLKDFRMIEILQMLNMNQKTGILTIYHDFDDGQIVLESGQITFALFHDFMGEEAIQKMAAWEHGTFIFEKDVVETEKNIEKPTMELILDCCKMLDESASV